jgi:hypothetical protein
MPLKKPNADDVRKMVQVNQIVDQRFLITTLAITMFGVITAGCSRKQHQLRAMR